MAETPAGGSLRLRWRCNVTGAGDSRQIWAVCLLLQSRLRNYLNHGHELYLTDNGVVLAYQSIAPMYLTFHYRPPHEKDPGGLRHEKE